MFRQEVVKAQRQKLLGNVIITQPISLYIICTMLCIIFIIIIVYLSQSHYSRKETVKGYITPKKGVVKVFSNRIGVVEKFYVKEGEKIKQGVDLVKIRNSQTSSTGVELSIELSNEISKQIKSLEQEYNAIENINKKDYFRIDSHIVHLNQSLTAIESSKKTIVKKIELKKVKLKQNKKLYNDGHIPSSFLDVIQEEYLEILEEHDRLDRERLDVESEISTLKYERLSLPEKLILNNTSINRRISELRIKLTELDNQYEFIKRAPESGIVTAIQTYLGSRVGPSTPLLSIIPIDSPLEIELFLPTRSAGFVQVGDKVNIRFDAFPYQKFGFVTGTVLNIDKALVLPTDKILPIQIDQAMYRVRAGLNHQLVKAYGKEFPLKIGMTADADIILEERSLLEWLLNPIYSVKGKLG